MHELVVMFSWLSIRIPPLRKTKSGFPIIYDG